MAKSKRYIVRNEQGKVIAREDTAKGVNAAIQMNVWKQLNKLRSFFDPKMQQEEGWRKWPTYLSEQLDLTYEIEDTTIEDTK